MGLVPLLLALAACDPPDGVGGIGVASEDRAIGPGFARPGFRRHEADGICWIAWWQWTDRYGEREALRRVYVRDGRPYWSRSGGITDRWLISDLAYGRTRVERVSGEVVDGRFVGSASYVTELKGERVVRYAGDGFETRWRDDGQLVNVYQVTSLGTIRDRYRYDDHGHLVGRSRSAPEVENQEWDWEWEGDRLLEETTRWPYATRVTEWTESDGDLPVRGETRTYHGGPSGDHVTVQVWSWDGDKPASYARLDDDGAEVGRVDWTWDGDRLLSAAGEGGTQLWTWDDEGRAVAFEEIRDGALYEHRTWTWDGDRLVEATHDTSDASYATTWSSACPPGAWSRSQPWPWVETPIPRPGLEEAPLSEW